MERKIIWIILVFYAVFLVLAPFSIDYYNSLNSRVFLDLIFLKRPVLLPWELDWPYPPLTLLFIYPGWLLYTLTLNEFLYQLIFKIPFLLSAVTVSYFIKEKTGSVKKMVDYLFNPAIILAAIIWGEFDVINSLFLVLLFILYRKKRFNLAFLSLSFAIAFRLYPLIVFPFLVLNELKNREFLKIIKYGIISMSIPFFSMIFGWIIGGELLLKSIFIQQGIFGPFGAFPLAQTLVAVANSFGIFILNENLMARSLIITLFFSELGLFIYLFKKKIQVTDAAVLSLLVFFLLYPKMHSPYILVLLPVGFLYKKWRLIRYIWIPGTVWALIVNGVTGNQGLWYWFSWLSDYRFYLPHTFNLILTVIFSFFQQVLLLLIIFKILKGKYRLNYSG